MRPFNLPQAAKQVLAFLNASQILGARFPIRKNLIRFVYFLLAGKPVVLSRTGVTVRVHPLTQRSIPVKDLR